MKSFFAKIISIFLMLALIVSFLCACNNTPINDENCDNGHNLVQQSYTAPTCQTSGQRIYKCSRCDYTETDTLLPIDHNYQTIASTPSTCSTHGNETVKCSMCYKEVTSELPLLNHNYELTSEKPSTCTIKGVKNYKCKDCEDTYSQELELLRHDYKTVNTATCFADGELKNVCNDCQHEEVIEDKPMLTHEFAEDGYCTKCGIYETLIDVDDLNITIKRGHNGSLVIYDNVFIRGNLTPKFKTIGTIPYTYFLDHYIVLTLFFYSENNEQIYSISIQSTVNTWQGNYQNTMTLQYGGFANGYANQIRVDISNQKLVEATRVKMQFSCEGYETIEKTYQID